MEEDDQLHQEEEAAEAIRQHQAELLEQEQQLQEAFRQRQEEEAIRQHQAELLEQEHWLQEDIRQWSLEKLWLEYCGGLSHHGMKTIQFSYTNTSVTHIAF